MLSLLPAVSAARPEAAYLTSPLQQPLASPGRLPTAFEWRPLATPPGFQEIGKGSTPAFVFPRPHQEAAAVTTIECGALDTPLASPRIPASPWMTNPATGSINNGNSNNNDPSPKMAIMGEGGGGSLFRPPPLGLSMGSDYSPPSPRLYPPPYPPYFSPQHRASPTSTPPSPSTPYFFPFPYPTRHYLQIESYSAVLANMGAAPPPPRPTPIFSASPSVQSQSPLSGPTQFGLYPPPLLHPPVVPPFGTGPAVKSPSAVPLFGNPPGLGVAVTPDCPPVSPASTPSPHSKFHELGPGSPPLSPYCFPCGKEGSLKHRFLVRPAGQGPSADVPGLDRSGQPPPPQAAGVESETRSADGLSSSPKRSRSSPLQTVVTSSLATTKAKPATVLQPHYPAHFMKGSIIQLANGELKCVEELRTEDFVKSAEDSSDLQIDSSTVVKIEEKAGLGTVTLGFSVGEQRIQVCVEATLEHPFFVFGQGWSSCFPERTLQRFALSCHQLQVGDVCISLTHRQRRTRHSESSAALRPALATAIISRTIPVHSAHSRKRRWSASDALTVTAVNIPVEQRSNSLAEASESAQ